MEKKTTQLKKKANRTSVNDNSICFAEVLGAKPNLNKFETVSQDSALHKAAPELLQVATNLLFWAKTAIPKFGNRSYSQDIKKGELLINRLLKEGQ